jgi:tetratricopeptide (TPR) repeat protein
VTAFAAAVAGGFVNTDVYLSQSRTYSSLNRFPQALASLEQAVKAEEAAGKKPPEDWYKFGFGQAYKGKLNNEFVKWTTMHIKAYPTPENWRSALVNYRDSQNVADKPLLDLYRLMLASNSLAGERDHYEYAFLASRAGLPGEVKSVADHFKSSNPGTTSASINELNSDASGKVTSDKASLTAEAGRAGSAANGVSAANVANAFIGYRDYAKAAELYKTALSKGGVDADEVNTRLGIALAMQGQKDAAKAAFGQVKSPARVGIASYWMAWLDRA